MASVITMGDYIIVQRQNYGKLHKLNNAEAGVLLGKDHLELSGVVGQPYPSQYRLMPKSGGKKRSYILERCKEVCSLLDNITVTESGQDNRNITDSRQSQVLKANDIERLRETCNSSTELVTQIIESSKTFSEKTEYAQDKYLKKKEKKYYEYIEIRKPTIRQLASIYYRQDPEKILFLRMDSLSQVISYSGVNSSGNYMLYDSGTSGLVPAAFLNSIGAGTTAQLLHVHPGNIPQQQALLALKLPKEQTDRYIWVNIYSVLRNFYQNSNPLIAGSNILTEDGACNEETPAAKRIKLDPSNTKETDNINATPKWQIANDKACKLFNDKLDGLTIIAKEHPQNILNELLPFVAPGRPVVIFNLCKEVLMELFVDLKTEGKITNLHLTSTFMRSYQILPNRTHPDVNRNPNSGYILYGYKI